jgi:hypothetical protein
LSEKSKPGRFAPGLLRPFQRPLGLQWFVVRYRGATEFVPILTTHWTQSVNAIHRYVNGCKRNRGDIGEVPAVHCASREN